MAASKPVVPVRLELEVVARLDQIVDALAERVRWRRVGRSDALRVVIAAGLEAEEARAKRAAG